MCFGASAAAPSSLLASLATGQCGVGGRMLGSNLNTISLCGTEKRREIEIWLKKTTPTLSQLRTSKYIFHILYNIFLLQKQFVLSATGYNSTSEMSCNLQEEVFKICTHYKDDSENN